MKREFIVNRSGREFVLYAGLLDEAHSQGLSAIVTELTQAPTAQNGQVAITHARVTTSKGSFDGIGDAAPDNVSRTMLPHLVRMAETRAKARALRDAINVTGALADDDSTHDELEGEIPPAVPKDERRAPYNTGTGATGNGDVPAAIKADTARVLRTDTVEGCIERAQVLAHVLNGRGDSVPPGPKTGATLKSHQSYITQLQRMVDGARAGHAATRR